MNNLRPWTLQFLSHKHSAGGVKHTPESDPSCLIRLRAGFGQLYAYSELYQTLLSWVRGEALPCSDWIRIPKHVRMQRLQTQRLPGVLRLTLHEEALWLPERALSHAAGRQQLACRLASIRFQLILTHHPPLRLCWALVLMRECSLAAQGGGSWLFPLQNGAPPIGWHDASAYLILPVLLVVSQYVSQKIISPPSSDPNQQSTQWILKFLPLMIGEPTLASPQLKSALRGTCTYTPCESTSSCPP